MNRALALPLLLIPGIATADVAPQDVWDNMSASLAALGLEVVGAPTIAGDTIVTSGMSLQATLPLGAGFATITYPELTLTDLGDGTVSVTPPETFALDFATDIPGDSEQVTFTIAVSQSGMDTVASGDPGDVTYTTDAADVDMLVSEILIPGEGDIGSLEIDTDGYQSVTRIVQASSGTITMTNALLNRPARTVSNFEFAGISDVSTSDTGDLTTNTTLVLPPDMSILNLTPALMAGLSITGEAQSAGGSSESVTSFEGVQQSSQRQTLGANTTTFAIDQNGLRMAGSGEGFDAEVMEPNLLPFPIAFSGESFGFEIVLPLVARDTPQDFTYAFNVGGLEIAETLWSIFDPTSSLNRAPASLGMDISGSVNWGLDVFDFAMYEALGVTGDVPISINSVDIRDISIVALGAIAKATGDFTFDNDDMQTIPGMPRPEGSAIVEASGVNAVMDQLMAAGLLGESDVAPARMMLGLFTRVTGDDSFETTVEVNAEGHVMVNGQRMR